VSLGLALMLGLLGLPHILMRFYTVPDARAARASVLYATGFIGYFYLIIPIVGFGASALVGREIIAQVDPGGNMARRQPRSTPFSGSSPWRVYDDSGGGGGLTPASAPPTTSSCMCGAAGDRLRAGHREVATIVFGALPSSWASVHGQNVAFMVGLASACLQRRLPPVLPDAEAIHDGRRRRVDQPFFWLLIVLSPTVWVDLFKYAQAIFPLRNPAIVSMPAAFVVGIVVSLMSREPTAEAMFDDEKIRTYLGVGAEESLTR
jgi:cation/acetate symporter